MNLSFSFGNKRANITTSGWKLKILILVYGKKMSSKYLIPDKIVHLKSKKEVKNGIFY
jgi:hypothetical protein